MTQFLQAGALSIIAAMVGILLKKDNPAGAAALALGGCTLVLLAGIRFLEPVIGILEELRALSGIGSQMMAILLKAAGIGLVGELAQLICADAGEAGLGKALGFLSGAAILWISLPLVREILEILQGILGEL